MNSQLNWEEFAEVTVRKLVKPTQGSPFLIITDSENDMNLAEACLAAGGRVGADTQLLVKQRLASGRASSPGPIISQAILGSKYVLEFSGGIVRSPAMLEARSKGARLLSTYMKGIENYAIRAVLDVDIDAMIRDAQRVADAWDKTNLCRVTSTHGTDVTFQLNPRKSIVGDGALSEDGEVDFFPGAQVSIAPVEETINGTIVVDCSDSTNGLVRTPYALTMKDGVIVDVQGQKEAAVTRRFLETRRDEKIYRLCHFSFGLNPKARIVGQALEDERVLSAVDFGFGFQDPSFGGTIGFSPFHWDVMMEAPAVFLDGKQLSGGGQLSPDWGFEITTPYPGWNF